MEWRRSFTNAETRWTRVASQIHNPIHICKKLLQVCNCAARKGDI